LAGLARAVQDTRDALSYAPHQASKSSDASQVFSMSPTPRRFERSLWMFVVLMLCAQLYVMNCRINKLSLDNRLFKKMLENVERATTPED
jgi:hypothetical protein